MSALPQASAQVLVESTVELENPAVKIDEIRAVVTDLTCQVIQDKVIFQGVLHKQIFYVREDGVVVHQAEDVRFSGFVDVPGAMAGEACRIDSVIEFVDFVLVDPTTLEQRVVIRVAVQTLAEPGGIIVVPGTQPITFFGTQGVTSVVTEGGMFSVMGALRAQSKSFRKSAVFSTRRF